MFKKITLSIMMVSSLSGFATNKVTKSADDAFLQLSKDYESRFFERFPEEGLLSGRRNVSLNYFSDVSFKAIEDWQKEEDHFFESLSLLKEEELSTPILQTSLKLFKQHLNSTKKARECKIPLWEVSPMTGWHIVMTSLAEVQPVGTNVLRRKALQRWNGFAELTTAEIENLKLGMESGFVAPKPPVQRVINQLEELINSPIESSPFYSLAKRDGDLEFKAQVKSLIENTINPSLARYLNFLKSTYLDEAREEVGLSAFPDGEECYRHLVTLNSTLEISAEDIHQLGLQEVARVRSEVIAIGKKRYGLEDVKEIFAKANEEGSHVFKTEQDMLDYDFAALARVNEKIPNYFKQVPKSEATIKPYPLHRAKNGAPGEYQAPGEDGSPGIFFINTYQPENKSRMDLEATLFHELVPGHHFEVALLYENKAIPSLNKYLWNSGFGEGWGLYAERLADEMGLYQDDVSKLGMLSNEALRASRLVVDSGLHALNWSRNKAVEYLKDNTGVEENVIEGEVDRYIMLPGQATAYMLGKLEIERLRNEAKHALGSKFTLSDFHYHVLKYGNISLPLLRAQIERDYIGK